MLEILLEEKTELMPTNINTIPYANNGILAKELNQIANNMVIKIPNRGKNSLREALVGYCIKIFVLQKP